MKVSVLNLLTVAAIAGLASGAARPVAPPPAPKPPAKKSAQAELMGKKLDLAKLVLEGLTMNDLAKAGKSADELVAISQKAEFMASKTREYELHTNDFRRALEVIAKKAKDGNLDGATLGYVNMTLTCVRCHQAVREVRIGGLPARGDLAVLDRR